MFNEEVIKGNSKIKENRKLGKRKNFIEDY